MSTSPPPAGNDRKLFAQLLPFMPEPVAHGIIRHAAKRLGLDLPDLEREGPSERVLAEVEKGVDLFVDLGRRQECKRHLRYNLGAVKPEPLVALSCPVTNEQDIVTARNAARQVAIRVGFARTDQIKIATAVSELARNIVKYAGHGTIELVPLTSTPPGIRIHAVDHGPGIAALDQIFAGAYKSRTGLGLGLCACKKLMNRFDIDTAPGKGTRVTMEKDLSR
jgi:serine/threonine-protein kinase RsbT